MSRQTIVSEWFQWYHQDIYNFLVYFTGRTDTEDLVQEVFIKAMKHAHRFSGKSSPKTWLISIARNLAIDDVRKKKRRALHYSKPLEDAFHIGDHETPETFIDQEVRNQELYQLIQSLRKNYRDVVILHGIQELSVAETAEVLDWSNQKVRTTYSRALKSLRKMKGGADHG
ncbi:RNA polymerase ECF-type sigma factor [Gracilibacillus halophilus YIM-C55.5]|uniref:RNA polymerase sigma factor n=1 Tax=Gracilibacillus halophilus YIM-C55.5 TaxID=1308866 RepID=N4WJ37_9BACI|nr:RNA polymerase sigma factor [Gracilibacillus halophilus]ENH96157.1 RNA polymerase ECF-type sigma factor [Gracilibacillus halophilus YIM-C55.5]